MQLFAHTHTLTAVEVKAYISNNIPLFYVDIIDNPSHELAASLASFPC